jgi:hypothetical protein
VSLVPLIAFGVAACALVVLGVAGPVYRLGASLATAYEIMRWAEYVGLAASADRHRLDCVSYRGRKWMGTIVSVLALIVALSCVAIPWPGSGGRSGCRRSTTSPPISRTRLPSGHPREAGRCAEPPRSNSAALAAAEEGYPDLAPGDAADAARGHIRFSRAPGAQSHGWEIVTGRTNPAAVSKPPTSPRWFGFTDDIVVRLGRRGRRDARGRPVCGAGQALATWGATPAGFANFWTIEANDVLTSAVPEVVMKRALVVFTVLVCVGAGCGAAAVR